VKEGRDKAFPLLIFHVEPRLPAKSLHHTVKGGARLLCVLGCRIVAVLRCSDLCRLAGAAAASGNASISAVST